MYSFIIEWCFYYYFVLNSKFQLDECPVTESDISYVTDADSVGVFPAFPCPQDASRLKNESEI